MDVMSSVTYTQAPRFLSLYRRLFGGGAGYWASANDHWEFRMDRLTGCPDETLLAIAEIASLAHWKATELRKGTLSVRELVRRGDQIEQALRQQVSRTYSDTNSPPPDYTGLAPEDTPLGMVVGLPAAMPSSPHSATQDTTSPTEDVRQLVAKIFRETAMLYLHTVLSEAHPSTYLSFLNH